MRVHSALLACVVLGLTASTADAVRRVEPLTHHAMISEGPAHRLLFKAEGIGNLGNVAVSRAYVEFAVHGDPAARALHLSLCPVTRAWSPGAVTWRSGWRNPGGDYDREMASLASVDLSRDERRLSFDVTPIVKEWIEGGAEFDGFLLNVQPRVREEGIRAEDLARLGALQGASLVVEYRRLPHRPPLARLGQ